MYDVPPSPGLISAANIRINKIKNNKLTFFSEKNYDFKDFKVGNMTHIGR